MNKQDNLSYHYDRLIMELQDLKEMYTLFHDTAINNAERTCYGVMIENIDDLLKRYAKRL